MKLKTCFFLLLAVIPLVPYSASALLMRESGPEPIIIQIKESLRQSDDLDAELPKLADIQRESSLRVDKRWAGPKFLELISFPKNFTEDEALAVIAKLQQLPAVEKVVALSAYNLEFRSGDFSREFPGNQAVPDVVRRGFDNDRNSRGSHGPPDIATAVQPKHIPNHSMTRSSSREWSMRRTRSHWRRCRDPLPVFPVSLQTSEPWRIIWTSSRRPQVETSCLRICRAITI